MYLQTMLPQALDTGASPTFARILVGAGTAAAPSYSFTNDTDTGLYSSGANELAFSLGGTARAYFAVSGANFRLIGPQGSSYWEQTSAGGLNFVASGTNQSITLTPSGTGFSAFGPSSLTNTVKIGAASGSSTIGMVSFGSSMDDTTKTAILGYDSILFVQSQGDIYFRSNGGSRKGTLLANGNWLFGTTVDSSALLQIGTNTTTLAGGAIFGTDTGFLRTAAGSLQIQHQGGTTPKFQLAGSVGPTVFLEFGHDGTQSYLSTQAAHNLDLRYNATAVLKLTSTTNAQIVGTKTLSFGATANATFGVSADTTAGILTITPPSSGSISLAGITAVGGATPSSTTYLNHPAGTTGVSPMRIPHGSAPTSPVNGDIWTTTAGIFVRINGATVGPLT